MLYPDCAFAVRRVAVGLAITALAACSGATTERAEPNDNRVAAGTLRNGVLTLQLEARAATWYPEGDTGPGLVQPLFAEVGRPAQNPGPLIRVPAGTAIQASLGNALRDTLVVFGLNTRPGSGGLEDTIQVAPGATRQLSFDAGAAGTYFYWGTTTRQALDGRRIDSELHGAFIIDDPGGTATADRGLTVGETYRIRLIDIMPDWTIRVSMMRGDSIIHWKALAKDGAELPAHAQVIQPAAFVTGPGQTMDFEYRPTAPGLLVFKVRHRVDNWQSQLPILVER